MNIKNISLIITAIATLHISARGLEKESEPLCCTGISTVSPAIQGTGNAVGSPGTNSQKLPRLVDLGASKCVPCKMMAPILEDLKKEYEGRMDVDFIDVWKTPEAAREYGVRVIPTQIFYGVDGKEFFRHEGFFAKEDILAKWKEVGVEPSVKPQ